jgi:hypothetical protein
MDWRVVVVMEDCEWHCITITTRQSMLLREQAGSGSATMFLLPHLLMEVERGQKGRRGAGGLWTHKR